MLRSRRVRAAIAVAAVLVAVVGAWVTASADFLAHPGWLAAQKADFVLGPVFVGLYWWRVRPESRFGPLLIAFGFVAAVYIVQSLASPWLFGAGVFWEAVIYLGNLLLILTFPTGRLDGRAAKLIMLVAAGVGAPLYLAVVTLLPQLGPDGSISGCRGVCPENGLAVTSELSLAVDLNDLVRITVIAVALATAALLTARMVRGTPPQRRAHAIGAPIALLFTAAQIAYQSLMLLGPDSGAAAGVAQWILAGARSVTWYGFLFALIAAQLFAGRVLHRMVRQSLRRPSPRELEGMLREPLGDPELRLVFCDPLTGLWADALEPGPGRDLTLVEGPGSTAVALLHDAQLNDDPELLRAAGAVALLAAENAELDAGWTVALDELRRSRARIVRAGDDERRKLERNLHDGVQQRLVAVRIKLGLVGEFADDATRAELEAVGRSVDESIDELREVAHGLYPPVLADHGLVAALGSARRRAVVPVAVSTSGVARHPPELESAVYYCCLEAIQNATKHGGPGVRVTVTLREDADELGFDVSDGGVGFDATAAHEGAGMQNMRDRLGALGGRLSVDSERGQGTVVSGTLPLRQSADQRRRAIRLASREPAAHA